MRQLIDTPPPPIKVKAQPPEPGLPRQRRPLSGWSFALLGALLGWPLMIGLVLGVLPDGISPASLVEAQAVPDDDPAAAYGQGERDSGPSGFWAQPVPAKVTIKVVIPADELAEEGQTPPAAPQAGVEEPPAPN